MEFTPTWADIVHEELCAAFLKHSDSARADQIRIDPLSTVRFTRRAPRQNQGLNSHVSRKRA